MRKPLSRTARRAGWVAFFHPQTRHKAGAFPGKKGTCRNFALNRIPADARIEVVRTVERQGRARSPSEPRRARDIAPYQQTVIVPPAEVREKFKRVKPLKDISVTERGWTLNVLSIVRRIVEERSRWGEATDEPAREDHRRAGQAARPTNTFTTADPALRDLYPPNWRSSIPTLELLGKRRKEFVPHRGTKAHKGRASGHERVQIRQQLQVLCDLGLLIHLGHGEWRLP